MQPSTINRVKLMLSLLFKDVPVDSSSMFCQCVSECSLRGARIWLSRMGILGLPEDLRDENDRVMSRSATAFLNGLENVTVVSVLRVARLTEAWQQQDAVTMVQALRWYDRYLTRMESVVDVSEQRLWLASQEVAWEPVMGVVSTVEQAFSDSARQREVDGDMSGVESLIQDLKRAVTTVGFPELAETITSTSPKSITDAMSFIDSPSRWSNRAGTFITQLIIDAIECCMDVIRERALYHNGQHQDLEGLEEC